MDSLLDKGSASVTGHDETRSGAAGRIRVRPLYSEILAQSQASDHQIPRQMEEAAIPAGMLGEDRKPDDEGSRIVFQEHRNG